MKRRTSGQVLASNKVSSNEPSPDATTDPSSAPPPSAPMLASPSSPVTGDVDPRSFVSANLQFLWALAQFGLSSVGMMIGNKLAVTHLPLPSTLVIMQVLGTLVLLLFFRHNVAPLRMAIVRQWLPIAALFTLMIYSSLNTFVYVSVSTVIIFRNIGAIFTTIVEYFARGVLVNTQVILAEVLIVVGAVLYGWGTANFSWVGFLWININVGGQVAYGVLVKATMDKPEFKDMSKYTMSMYNNLLALPMLAAVFVLQGEHLEAPDRVANLSERGWFYIAVTCLLGFMISTSGFGLQKLVSATTFLVINNLTKFLNIALGMMFLSDKLVGLLDASGCAIALLAGFRYSQCMMQLHDAKKEQGAEKKGGVGGH